MPGYISPDYLPYPARRAAEWAELCASIKRAELAAIMAAHDERERREFLAYLDEQINQAEAK